MGFVRNRARPNAQTERSDHRTHEQEFEFIHGSMAYPVSNHYTEIGDCSRYVSGSDRQAAVTAGGRILQAASPGDASGAKAVSVKNQGHCNHDKSAFADERRAETPAGQEISRADDDAGHNRSENKGDNNYPGCRRIFRVLEGDIYAQVRDGPRHVANGRMEESKSNRVNIARQYGEC